MLSPETSIRSADRDFPPLCSLAGSGPCSRVPGDRCRPPDRGPSISHGSDTAMHTLQSAFPAEVTSSPGKARASRECRA